MASRLRLALAAMALLMGVALLPSNAPTSASDPEPLIVGDFDCDADIDAVDALKILRAVAGLGALPGCVPATDINCDAATTAVDALIVLRDVAGLPVSLGGCPPLGSLDPDTPPTVAAEYLAEKIMTGSLVDAVASVQEALSWAGVTTRDLENEFFPVQEPKAGAIAAPSEVLNLALEARDRESVFRMNAGELGQILIDLGWPPVAGMMPDEQFLVLLTVWHEEAMNNPEPALNFPIFFIVEVLQRSDPAVDLADETLRPEDVRLGQLDVKLILASFDRVTLNPEPAAIASLPGGALSQACAFVNNYLTSPFSGGLLGPLAYIQNISTNSELKEAMVRGGADPDDLEGAGAYRKAMNAAAILFRLMDLINLYSHAQIDVDIQGDNPVHKNNETDPGDLLKEFTATAGINEEDWNEYVQTYGEGWGGEMQVALHECLAESGIPVPESVNDLAQQIPTWSVEWIMSGPAYGPHADWREEHQISPGMTHQLWWRGPLQVSGPYSGTTSFVVWVKDEKTSDHPGALREAPLEVCGNLETAQPPSAEDWARALGGFGWGLAVSIVDLAAGFIQEVATQRDCPTLHIEYHEKCLGPEPPPAIALSQGGADIAPPCAWEGTMTATQWWDIGYNSGMATARFTGKWETSDEGQPTTGFLCGVDPCTIYRPEGTINWTWDNHLAEACDETLSGSLAAGDPDYHAQFIVVKATDEGSLKYWANGSFEPPEALPDGFDCPNYIGQAIPPGFIALDEQASGDGTPDPAGNTCGHTDWRVNEADLSISGSCYVWNYGYSWELFEWDLTADVCPGVAGSEAPDAAIQPGGGPTC